MRQYIYFNKMLKPRAKKTHQWKVMHDRSFKNLPPEQIGLIGWHGAWHQYVFVPEECTLWSKGCLEEVVKKLATINKEWRELKKKGDTSG